jgi:hypothetical protein
MAAPSTTQERMVEWSVESSKKYSDPFNDVNVDVIFSRSGQSWRVPMFWRGGERWTVRFAPPVPGDYSYRLESTDRTNSDLNGHAGRVSITAYRGTNELLQRGMLRVSANKRYFEQADGTPFYWLGDTWWMGLSDRLSWDGFQELAADRQAKGFTVVQMAAGLVPAAEERAPVDPGFHNEGGAVWDPQFQRINPQYFDYADRRIEYLLDHGIAPAIAGAWSPTIVPMGVAKMKQHWRYIVARYGAYPVFWILGGQVLEPPDEEGRRYPTSVKSEITPGWTEVAKYLRSIDPYHHPLTVHENPPPYDTALQNESLTDFDMFQSSHFGWPSIAVEVSQMDQHYSRTQVTKPVVEGEIGYEKLGETHLEDFQRTAFWLSMLNGAAGHTYGANGVFEAYTPDKPLHRLRWSLLTWQEGMKLPGSYQIGIGAKLLREYPWWRFEPHPEWVTPRGTTLLEPHVQAHGFEYGTISSCDPCDPLLQQESIPVAAEWKAQNGSFQLPYAAGIPREVRFIYVPTTGLDTRPAPTIQRLERNVHYHAFWWEPSLGVRIDLGAVAHPGEGPLLFSASQAGSESAWDQVGLRTAATQSSAPPSFDAISVLKNVRQANLVVHADVVSSAEAGLVVRCQDAENYVGAVYSPKSKSLYFIDRRQGSDGPKLGETIIPQVGERIALSAEVRGDKAAASISDGEHTYSTPIIDLTGALSGRAGFLHDTGSVQRYTQFQVRGSPELVKDDHLQRRLFDAKGMHRGDLSGEGVMVGTYKIPGWADLGLDKYLLLDAYRPDRMPMSGDWVLVLDAMTSAQGGPK